ncbi:division/cell wall cluster transcriptional repressor MraZ [Companilactobacillus sp. DQM5]|uniref:division/cell wall cluster transcriptional repressor MraZ n=1 Tax=Companilactobacillus sp. DQM5 TaxID=3463359 RepID=UPI004059772E
MFMGEYNHTLDAKGRVIVPAKFRQSLGDDFVLTKGMDGCLFGYPNDQWKKLEEQLDQLPLTKKDARAFVRFFYSSATETEIDKQGRINISSSLMDYADLDKNCVIVGVSNRIEIWDKERWNEFSDNAAENFDDISEKMMDFDL